MKTFTKKATFISLLFITFSLLSCISYKEVKVIEVKDVGVKNFTLKGVDVEVAMQIKNPNNYNIKIVDSDLEVLIKENRIGTATIENKIVLPKNSNQVHRFIIRSTLKDMGSNVFPLLMTVLGGGTIELQIKGDIKATAKGIGKRFPVDFKENVKI